MQGKSIDMLQVGDAVEFSKTLSESDIYQFAGITGDLNPVHINQAFAERTYFKQRIAHGMLTASFISTCIGMHLPGPGTVYLSQDIQFKAAAFIGDTITARVEVIEILAEKKRVRLKTTCARQDGTLLLEGEALVSPPRAT